MTNGHTPRAPAASAAARVLARASGTWGGYRAWHKLEPSERLELVDKALGCAANDSVDCFPLAL